jgi:hypothetical protein
MLEEGSKAGLIASGVPESVATWVASGIGLLSTTILMGLTIYLVDHFDEALKELQVVAETIMFGLTHSAQSIKRAYEEAIEKVDSMYQDVMSQMIDYYARLNKLADMAHDFNLPASIQFRNSISYGQLAGVDDDLLLRKQEDIVNFFND